MPSQSLPVSLSLTFSLSFSHQMNFNHGAFISNTHMLHLHTALATTSYATISAYTHIAERTLAYFYNANSGKRKVIIGNCCLNLKNSITLLELRGNFKAPQLHLYMRFAYMCVTSAQGRHRGNVIEYRSHTIMIYLPSIFCHCIHKTL